MSLTPALQDRLRLWRSVVGPPLRVVRLALLAGGLVLGGLVARQGTALTRSAAALLIAGVLVGLVWVRLRRSRGASDPLRAVRVALRPVDAELGRRALRAARLLQAPAARSARSAEMARLHFTQVVEQASLDAVRAEAGRRATRLRWLGAVGLAAASVLIAFEGQKLGEGFNVLLAQEGRAPLSSRWLREIRVVARAPDYVGGRSVPLHGRGRQVLPVGTELSLRGRPRLAGRNLVWTDGQAAIPLVSDGAGGVVAHYTVSEDTSLEVAAVFGGVQVAQRGSLQILARPDQAPKVTLREAPRTLRLRDLRRLELHWGAQDDYGLRQVDLVLRSGSREERRPLAHFEGEVLRESGAHALSPGDPFLREMFLPVEVSIEARDNDPFGGSKWGSSHGVTIQPRALGEAQAERYLALAEARGRYVDALATLLDESVAGPTELEPEARALRALERALSGNYSGLTVRPGLRNFALGQVQRLPPEGAPAKQRRKGLGALLVGFDAAFAGLARTDAEELSVSLGNVAEEVRVWAERAGRAEGPRQESLANLERSLSLLAGGSQQLKLLGLLGADLGAVAEAGLGRIRAALSRQDLLHTELAAQFLSERLRRPTPSFSSSGGGEGMPNPGPSGRGQGSGDGQPSSAPDEFDRLARDLTQLAQEHSDSVRQVRQSLDPTQSQEARRPLAEAAARRAAELRRVAQALPDPGYRPGTPEAAAALVAEQVRTMARHMDSLRLESALQAADGSLKALEAATRRAQRPSVEAQLDAVQKAVEEQRRWLAEQRQAGQERAERAARPQLQQAGRREQELARLARELSERGQQQGSALPKPLKERLRSAQLLMQRAAQQLRQGRGAAGLQSQEKAQKLLEGADQGATRPDSGQRAQSRPAGGREGVSGRDEFGGPVPDADPGAAAEAFRRRVVESLAKGQPGQVGEALERYAEGLIR